MDDINKTDRNEETRIKNVNEFLNWIKQLSETKNIYIAGAGKFGKELGKFLTGNNIKWKGYVDRNSSSLLVCEKKIYPYSMSYTESDYFIVSSFLYKEAIVSELNNAGIENNNIYVTSNLQDIIYEVYDSMIHWSLYTEKVKRFHNMYAGKRCFIIGNGPSLDISDLEKLEKEITFASNFIYALYGSTSWRPTFHCILDDIACKKLLSEKKDILKIASECESIFTDIISEGFNFRNCEELGNLFYVKSEKKDNPETGHSFFSEDCSKQIYVSGTVTFMALQLAVYMGFQEIYLLGVDCSYSVERYSDEIIKRNNIINHHALIQQESVEEEKQAIKKWGTYADIPMQIDGYKSAKIYADINGIKIYNATRGGKLEVFKRVDFDSLF